MLRAIALVGLVGLYGCASRSDQAVERLGGTHDTAAFRLTDIRGTRDGDRLEVHAVFGDGSQSLNVRLHVNITPPPKLASGTWKGLDGEGVVRERSLTFLGGQSAGPSIGGRFDLLGSDERPLYRITIPLQELKRPL